MMSPLSALALITSNIHYHRSKVPLKTWDLHVNEAKTEWVELISSNTSNEAWRSVKVLGSLLGDEQDVQRKKQQATIAFRKMTTLWFRRSHVNESRRIRLYQAYVLPTLTYNIGTWGLTKREFNSFDTFHCKQLRFLLGIFYPDHISNKALYEHTHSRPISSCSMEALRTHPKTSTICTSQQSHDSLFQST